MKKFKPFVGPLQAAQSAKLCPCFYWKIPFSWFHADVMFLLAVGYLFVPLRTVAAPWQDHCVTLGFHPLRAVLAAIESE